MIAAKIYVVFILTYGGMIAGRLPWIRIDRTGIALVGVTLLLVTNTLSFDEVNARIDPPTLILLFALMIISDQFVIAGFIDRCVDRIAEARGGPLKVLALTVAISGMLAAFLTNDVLVFVSTPLLIEAIRRRGLNPKPYLVALIAASNAGSAATIIGAPQTILIGQLGDLNLGSYLGACAIPAVVALLIVYGIVALLWRNRLDSDGFSAEHPFMDGGAAVITHPFDRYQTNKAIVALVALLALFSTSLPRDIGALAIMAFMLLNRKFSSRSMIAAVDWPLLILFYCLFGVAGALGTTSLPAMIVEGLQDIHLLPNGLAVMAPLTLLMSNALGNVPFTIMLLQIWPDAPSGALYGLALLSSLAGNLLLSGSISNLLICERAVERGVIVKPREFAKAGVPITILSMAFAVIWLEITGFMPWKPY